MSMHMSVVFKQVLAREGRQSCNSVILVAAFRLSIMIVDFTTQNNSLTCFYHKQFGTELVYK